MAAYNGHKNWNYWNVSLWLGNDEGLYNLAKDCIRLASNKREAATDFVGELASNGIHKTPDGELASNGIHKTPDGARYTASSVLAAMRDL